jgi:hypothetical protein
MSQIAASLRVAASKVDELVTLNYTDPRRAAFELGGIMLALKDAASQTAALIAAGIRVTRNVRPGECFCGQCEKPPASPSAHGVKGAN